LLDSRLFYNTLFASVWQSLKTLGYSHYGAESGALAILHTWGQNLSLHPHIHCLVPAAGITLAGNIKNKHLVILQMQDRNCIAQK